MANLPSIQIGKIVHSVAFNGTKVVQQLSQLLIGRQSFNLNRLSINHLEHHHQPSKLTDQMDYDHQHPRYQLSHLSDCQPQLDCLKNRVL